MLYIDKDKCTGCGACVDVCPPQAISIQNDVAVISQRLCRQCGSCATVCPTGAVHTVAPVLVASGKGGDEMRGKGWFGLGYPGQGRGRGNPYPFCRFYPWLPRRWWAYGSSPYPQMTPAYRPAYRSYRW